MKRAYQTLTTVLVLAAMATSVLADVKVKQRVTTNGVTFETTKMIKGSRERTESKTDVGGDPSAAAIFPQIATVTQCDLKRIVQLNDKKRLYFIEPMETVSESTPTARGAAPAATGPARKGGTVTVSNSVRDTGERKTIFGMQARHIIMTTEMVASADSCGGPSQTKIEHDGWYVDFSADFSCRIKRTPQIPEQVRSLKPDCVDHFIVKGGGAGDPGFMLEGTMKMFGPDGKVQMTQTTETLELSRSPLDQAFFELPTGYAEVKNQQDLYKVSYSDMVAGAQARGDNGNNKNRPMGPTVGGGKPVGVELVFASGTSQASQAEARQYLFGKLASRGLSPVMGGGGDVKLKVDFRQVKESAGSKVGGLFGKVTGVDTKAGSVTIEMVATLSTGGEAKVKDKFDGTASSAMKAALDQALDQLLANIK